MMAVRPTWILVLILCNRPGSHYYSLKICGNMHAVAYLEIVGQARCWPSLSRLFETVALPTPYDRFTVL